MSKTTSARESATDHRYCTWDLQSDRMLSTAGPDSVAAGVGLGALSDRPHHVVFDELHEYRRARPHWHP